MHKLLSRDIVTQLKSAMARRDRVTVNACVAELNRRSAPMGRQWRALAELMVHNGEVSLAKAAIENYVQAVSGSPPARFEQAVLLARVGRLSEAQAIVSALPPSIPDRQSNAYLQGTIAAAIGHTAAARGHLLDAVAADPSSGQAFLALAMVAPVGDREVVELVMAAEKTITSSVPLQRAQYAFAKARILDATGNFDEAFSALDGANALVSAERPYRYEDDLASARAALAGWNPEAMDVVSDQVDASSDRVIFVTGAPRSGSTLVEQILVSHTGVVDGGELGLFGIVGEAAGGVSVKSLGIGGQRKELASLYLHLVAERFGPNGRVVDKTLDASRYLGLATRLLPKAPVIWIRRDPVDVALSCYQNFFPVGLNWTFDLDAIAQHLALEKWLLKQWADRLGDRLLVLDYESLVKTPNTEIPRLLNHCSLSVEPQVFTPELTQRTVSTASVMQVRQPINQGAVGSARRYAAQLQPFAESYAKACKLLQI